MYSRLIFLPSIKSFIFLTRLSLCCMAIDHAVSLVGFLPGQFYRKMGKYKVKAPEKKKYGYILIDPYRKLTQVGSGKSRKACGQQ
jgi:hypothetical protein